MAKKQKATLIVRNIAAVSSHCTLYANQREVSDFEPKDCSIIITLQIG